MGLMVDWAKLTNDLETDHFYWFFLIYIRETSLLYIGF